MKTGNQNKLFKEVAALNELPKNIAFNANKTWVVLEENLQPKKTKKLYWLWFAASIVLIFATTFFYINNNSKVNIVVEKKDIKFIEKKEQATTYTTTNTVVTVLNEKQKKEEKANTKTQLILQQDTLQNIVENTLAILIDTNIIVKKRSVPNTSLEVEGSKRKKLKVMYASDFYDTKDETIKQQELVKEQPKKYFFKLFETPINKETEENTAQENIPPINKTFLGFKLKPTATISINENQ